MTTEDNILILEDEVIRLSDEEIVSVLEVLPNHKKYKIGSIEISPNYSTGYTTDELRDSADGSGSIYIADVEHDESITISKEGLSDIIDALTNIEELIMESEEFS